MTYHQDDLVVIVLGTFTVVFAVWLAGNGVFW